jgi:hypothetical protein
LFSSQYNGPHRKKWVIYELLSCVNLYRTQSRMFVIMRFLKKAHINL